MASNLIEKESRISENILAYIEDLLELSQDFELNQLNGDQLKINLYDVDWIHRARNHMITQRTLQTEQMYLALDLSGQSEMRRNWLYRLNIAHELIGLLDLLKKYQDMHSNIEEQIGFVESVQEIGEELYVQMNDNPALKEKLLPPAWGGSIYNIADAFQDRLISLQDCHTDLGGMCQSFLKNCSRIFEKVYPTKSLKQAYHDFGLELRSSYATFSPPIEDTIALYRDLCDDLGSAEINSDHMEKHYSKRYLAENEQLYANLMLETEDVRLIESNLIIQKASLDLILAHADVLLNPEEQGPAPEVQSPKPGKQKPTSEARNPKPRKQNPASGNKTPKSKKPSPASGTEKPT